MNEMRLNKARLNVVSLNKALINGAVERHGSSAGGGGAPSKYIRFADPAVEAVLMANGVSSDGVGITKEDAAAVTSIGTWFRGNTAIQSFDELKYFTGVTEIKDNAFNSCTALASINLDNVTIIRKEAFYGCSALSQYMRIPQVTILGNQAFRGCGIVGADISGVQVLTGGYNGGAFGACSSLREVIFSPSLTDIQQFSFINCTSLESANIPASVTAIGTQAFYNCTSLAFDYLNLPNLTTLGGNVFYKVKIKKLNLGKLTTLPSASTSSQNYGDKSVLEEIVIPEGVTSIPNNSFDGYAALTSIKFQNTITLGEYAFRNCTALSDVDWDKIAKIGYGAFYKCTSLPSEISIPNMTGEIGQYAFTGCTSIIRFSASATSVAAGAFDSSNIEEVTLLNAVSLGVSAFNRNYKLKVVRLRDVTTFTGDVFYACSNLETVIVDNITPPSLSSNAFQAASSTFIIYVPDAALEVYKTATNWSTYADRIHPLSELEGSPYITFADAEVERVLMENNVSSDGVGITMADAEAVTDMTNTFYQNTAITSFDELEQFTNLVSLGTRTNSPSYYGTFSGCTNLKSVVLPPSVKTIGAFAFDGCSSLEQVGDLSGVETIGPSIFYDCAKLAVVIYMPSLATMTVGPTFHSSGIVGVGNLGKGVLGGGWNKGIFQNCKSLRFAILPSSVTNITGYDFSGCTALQTLIMRNESPCTLGSLPTNLVSIYVPDASVDAYKEASGWSSYSAKIKPMSSIESDSLYAEFEQYL